METKLPACESAEDTPRLVELCDRTVLCLSISGLVFLNPKHHSQLNPFSTLFHSLSAHCMLLIFHSETETVFPLVQCGG